MRKAAILWVVSLAALCLWAFGQQKRDSSWDDVRKAAEAQHEIIVLSIKLNNFNQVLPEIRKVLALKFPQEHESKLSREIDLISDELMHRNQFEIAYKILDEGMVPLRVNSNKATLLKRKAYILKKQGRDEEALQCLKQAVALESTGK